MAKTAPTKVSATASPSDEVVKQLRKIQTQLKRQNSFGLAFARGLVTGLGATVGVAIVVTLSAFVILQVARFFGAESAAQDFVETFR